MKTKESKTPMAAGVKISRAALTGSMPPGTSSMDSCFFQDLVQMFLDGREFSITNSMLAYDVGSKDATLVALWCKHLGHCWH